MVRAPKVYPVVCIATHQAGPCSIDGLVWRPIFELFEARTLIVVVDWNELLDGLVLARCGHLIHAVHQRRGN